MTRLVLMSDIHDQRPTVPEGDVLILAGDVFVGDDLASLRHDLAWIKSLPHRWKCCVRGNHDLILKMQMSLQPEATRELLRETDILLLENDSVKISDLTLHGIGWRAPFSIPASCDVLISHEPPFGILDSNQQPGSKDILKAVAAARVRHHVFGHVHQHGGQVANRGATLFYNCAGKAKVLDV